MMIHRQAMDARTVADGFVSLEGPVVGGDGCLYVADLRGGGIHTIWPDGRRAEMASGRMGIGGLALHREGGLVASGPTIEHLRSGRPPRVLLDIEDVGPRPGTTVIGFNDIVADTSGRIIAGVQRVDHTGDPAPGELVRIASPRACEVVHADLHPNGLAWSPDHTVLYAADTFRRRLLVLAAAGDDFELRQSISTAPIDGLPDGLATDTLGGVWVAFYRGGCIARIDPAGDSATVVNLPIPKPLSLCFDVVAPHALYVVTGRSEPGAPDTGAVVRIDTAYRGASVPLATI